MMDAGTLADAIAVVCPVTSARCIDPDNRATWSFQSGNGATQPQVDAGNNVIATINVTPKATLSYADFITRWTNPEYQLLITSRAQAGNIGMTKRWDTMVARGVVDMNRQQTNTVKSDLVAAGVLTQVRADAIFA